MAAYPSVRQNDGSTRRAVDFAVFDYSESGLIRGRDFTTNTPYEFEIHHRDVSASDAASIESHFDAHGVSAVFAFVWASDGATYNVHYRRRPDVNPSVGAQKDVVTMLVGNKA